jgi:calcium-translocating P-type ATPase
MGYNKMDGGQELTTHLISDKHQKFGLDAESLEKLINLEKIHDGTSAQEVERHSLKGFAAALKSDLKYGIDGSEHDVKERAEHYGTNEPKVRVTPSFWSFVWEKFDDTTLKILIVAAAVSLVLGLYENPKEGWMEGTAILIAILLVVLVGAVNDYFKEKQFEALSKVASEKTVTVVRGGQKVMISIYKILVGDVLQLQTGDIIPVDGVVIRASGLVADESSLTGESDPIKKGWDDKMQPFVLSGSKVAEGTGDILVICVGKRSFSGKMQDLIQSSDEDDETPLEKKLNRIAGGIGKVGLIVATLTLLVLVVYIFVDISNTGWGEGRASQFLVAFITAVTILVVAVPEGLPLAVTLSLAFSVGQMKKENNLVRHLDACETMGGATQICSDKTGTLTQNIMSVVKLWTLGKYFDDHEFQASNFNHDLLEHIAENIIQNSTAEIKLEPSPQPGSPPKASYIGSRSECALLQLAEKLGFNYSQLRNSDKIFTQIPFSSKQKRMSTVVRKEEEFSVYVKGASEIVLDMCDHYINSHGHRVPIDDEVKENIQRVIASFAEDALRTLTLAYKTTQDGSELKNESNEPIAQNIEYGLTLLSIVGIADPIRKEVPDAVSKCHHAGITVRMVTGDNITTATAIAKKCGILDQDYKKKGEHDYTVMEGFMFRELVQGTIKVEVEGKEVYKVGNMEAFKVIAERLKVLARSSPEDKFTLVTGLKALDQVVAVTGDGSNDAPALKKSDVGFAMHIAGTQLAKDASDIVLLDDNFASIVTAVKWGRNIYDSIRKFLQFQLTVNIVALVMAFIGAVVLKFSPLSAVQMLWVNLIMDTFAALALATEPPSDDLLNRKPYSKHESLLTADMSKNIIGQSLYQIIILNFVLFVGHDILNLTSPFSDVFKAAHSDLNEENLYKVPNEHFTFFFNTFVFLQVFNEINCRKLRSDELNVFKNFFNNSLFLIIMILTIGVQILIVTYGG